MSFSLTFTGDWEKFQGAIKTLGTESKARGAYRKIINRQGAVLRKQAVRILPGQVGLTKKTISKALGAPVRASNANLSYKLTTRGGFISYKFFGARETPQGVFAKPRGQNVFLPNHFTKSARFPSRQPLFGGHVFKLKGGGNAFNGWGRKITKVRSDVRIPDEMVRSDMKRAYDAVARDMEPALAAEIMRLTKGVVG